MFHHGTTDRPQIGTTEDWYFINPLFEPHPMHLHLVNFQLVNTFSLKKTPDGCIIYELDFFRISGYSLFKGLNNADLCQKLNAMTIADTDALYSYLEANNLFDSFTNKNIGKVYGLNIL